MKLVHNKMVLLTLHKLGLVNSGNRLIFGFHENGEGVSQTDTVPDFTGGLFWKC